jgi:hypothetical protein
MSQSTPRRLLLACLFVAAAGVVPRASQGAIAIRIYDGAATDAASRAAAIQTAAAIVAEAGIPARWYDCTGDAERGHCDHLRHVRTLTVRLRPALTPGTTLAGGSVETRTRPDASGLILGFAVVDSSAGAGVLATIFMDRIRSVAQRTSVAIDRLLGRAIAHEVGHLLLATNTHSGSGLMREIWTDAELAVDRGADWLFAPADRLALQKHVTVRLKPDSTDATADVESAFRRTDALQPASDPTGLPPVSPSASVLWSAPHTIHR